MAKHQFSHRRVKRLRTYDVGEAARATNVTTATVRAWIKRGLLTVPQTRPTIIRGADLIQFLQNQKQTRKKPCGAGRIFCLSCKEPKRPAFDEIEFVLDGPKTGSLVGMCPNCSTIMRRRSSLKSISLAIGGLKLITPHKK